ncbi:BTAD domain-containing putative transcriptional regulator [Promicromonospora thailandica]|uniref:DNA-binding transcriptional activator of the SARP family n=1 Tax=Promicromonospora thailandica TaxID=765201 RepID=A0A9X2JW41_9MICO|nr:BTAD domain-containing putative transcriptional regulator [Promicromonospora thailandica]MCP2262729.1 DNA-binding transcriptional activator of the SARP family [Promicromonospora thailandica]
MSDDMTFALLGPVRMWRAGTELPAGSPQQRALAAMLLLHEGRVVGIDEMATALWEDEPPRGAFGTLRTYVSRLRRLLEGTTATIDTVGGGYALRTPQESVDVARFETLLRRGRELGRTTDLTGAATVLTEALDLWQGDGLDGVPGAYAAHQRVRLQEERLAARTLRLAALLDTGGSVVPELTTLVEAHPYREELRALLMRALYRDGRQADAIDAYHTGARLLGDELGLDPGPALREMHQRILVSDPTLTVTPRTETSTTVPDGSARAEQTPVPHPAQLPADQRGFVGRHRELAWADALLDTRAAPTTAVISGMGGVGKSALAVHWAHHNATAFPDGQLYVDLRGFDHTQAPVKPHDALIRLLEALGIAGQHVPDSLDARAALFRSALAGRRMLVLLDNARDADQVRPLLPGTGDSLALVTSRHRLSALCVAGAASIHLDVLPDDDAKVLLTHRAGPDRADADPESLDRIVRATGRLPLALAVVGARLADSPDIPLRVIADELGSAHTVLDSLGDPDPTVDVRAVLSWSCTALDPAALHALRQLAVLPEAAFDVPAARSAVGHHDPVPVDALVRASLLVRTRPGWYALHDLVRACAAEFAVKHPEARREAVARVLDHYLGSAHRATMLLEPRRVPLDLPEPTIGTEVLRHADATAAFDWLAGHRRTLRAAVDLAVTERSYGAAWQLAWCLAAYLHRAGYWSDAVNLWQVALGAAERDQSVIGQARTHQGLGVALGMSHGLSAAGFHPPSAAQDDTQAAACAHVTEAIRLYLSIGMRAAAAWALVSLASLHDSTADPDAVTDALERARELSDEPSLQVAVLNNLAVLHARLGDGPRAVAAAREVLDLIQTIGDTSTGAHATDTLGMAQMADDDPGGATTSFRAAARAFEAAGDPMNQGVSLANLGDAYVAAGDAAAAQAARAEALAVLDGTGHPVSDRLRVLLGQPAEMTDVDR